MEEISTKGQARKDYQNKGRYGVHGSGTYRDPGIYRKMYAYRGNTPNTVSLSTGWTTDENPATTVNINKSRNWETPEGAKVVHVDPVGWHARGDSNFRTKSTLVSGLSDAEVTKAAYRPRQLPEPDEHTSSPKNEKKAAGHGREKSGGIGKTVSKKKEHRMAQQLEQIEKVNAAAESLKDTQIAIVTTSESKKVLVKERIGRQDSYNYNQDTDMKSRKIRDDLNKYVKEQKRNATPWY
eukprot:PhF_6_TR41572/c0_g1_i4/m.62992